MPLRNKNLPYETKHTFCVDVANGLSALHDGGIIHGDIKPDNILIFENSRRLVAKIADFSHSLLVLETKKEAVLPGGTIGFRAPEWKQKLPTSLLCNTDVYSYGIVFASVILGHDVIATFSVQPRYGRTGEERAQHLDLLQKNGKFKDILNEMLYDTEDTDLTLRRERLQMIQSVLDLTLHEDIAMRDLSAVKRQLQISGWSNSLPDSGSAETLLTPRTGAWESTVLKQINSNIVSGPMKTFPRIA
jgi:serine/threonine protein kinase